MRHAALVGGLVWAWIAAAAPVAAQDIDCDRIQPMSGMVDPMVPLPLQAPLPTGIQAIGVDFGDGLTTSLPVTGGEAPLAPIFMPAPMVGGPVRLSLQGAGQGAGAACDLGDVVISALPAAPGTLRGMLDASRANASFFEATFGLSRSASGHLEGQVSALPPAVQSLLLWQDDLEIVVNHLTEDPLANALVAQMRRTGILPAAAPALRRADLHLSRPVRMAQAGGLGTIGAIFEQQCPANADELALEVEAAFQAWAYTQATAATMNRASALIASGSFGISAIGLKAEIGALAAGSAATPIAATVATTAGIGISVGMLIVTVDAARNDILSKVLIRDMSDLELSVTRSVFHEDAATIAELTGTLTRVGVRARSRGGDVRAAMVSIATASPFLRGFEFFVGVGATKAVEYDIANNGNDTVYNYPVRECAIDISGPDNVVTRIVPLDYPASSGWDRPAPVLLITHANLQAVDVGRALLLVTTVPNRFGDNTVSGIQPLEVLEVYLTLDPATQYITPGDAAGISVKVHNSAHPAQRVNYSVVSGQIADVATPDGLDHVVFTQSDPATLPVLLAFEPTILRGLMQRATSRNRTIFAAIRPERLSLSNPPFCLEAGAEHVFTASYAHEAMTLPSLTTDRGRIAQDGVYTAPAGARGETATVTARLGDLETHVSFRIGGCTCFWEMQVRGQSFEGYYGYVPALLDQTIDRNNNGIIDLFPMVDGIIEADEDPTITELGVRSLIVNYPREVPGPGISIVFDNLLRLGSGRVLGHGGMTFETAPGIRTDMSRALSSDAVSVSYTAYEDFLDFRATGTFSSAQDGRVIETQFLSLRGRVRAGISATSACEGPDAPLPGRWLTDALPSLPSLPQINR